MKRVNKVVLFFLFLVIGMGIIFGYRFCRTEKGIRRFSKWNIPEPTPQQSVWQKMRLGMFVHFGMTTFSGEVGKVTAADSFNPVDFNAEQWMRAAVAMGAKYAILTAQHVDGFLLWQSDAYDYGVRQSSWMNGKGDVVREFIGACHKYGIKPGLYLNIADNNYWGVSYPGIVKAGKNSLRQKEYNQVVEKMVTELCSNYGELFEIWFDGGVLSVKDGGPDVASIIKRLQPNAMVMKGQDASTIRLAGGETGTINLPFYNTARYYYSMGRGNPAGKLYLPVECDAPVRKKQWFWREGTDDNLLEIDDLIKMYEGSVKRGANLLLNANPDKRGLIPEQDMALYMEFGKLKNGQAQVGADPSVRPKCRRMEGRRGKGRRVEGRHGDLPVRRWE